VNPSATQLRRLLALLPRIADGQEHAIADVARQLGVDAQTVSADLHALSERYGDPPGWIEKVAVYIERERISVETGSQFRRPMRLAPAESRALELGLSLLRAESSPERQRAIDAARERLRELVSVSEDDTDAMRAASIGTARHLTHVPALRDALKSRRRVAIHYHKGSGERAERRVVCPFTFVTEKGAWYLVAHSTESQDIRIYRLDRIERVELLAETFDAPPSVDVDALLERGAAFAGDASEKLRVRYSANVARWIIEREEGTKNAGGSYEVAYPLADTEWAVRHVLQYGPEAEVIAPQSVREAIVRRLQGALA
jgi:proteasome accessory factor C